jgi:hypothetical protein
VPLAGRLLIIGVLGVAWPTERVSFAEDEAPKSGSSAGFVG